MFNHKNKMINNLLGLSFLLGLSSGVLANPEGGQVIAGQAIIQQESSTKIGITQGSDKAIINWQKFNIAPNEHTQFYQPSNKSITLNRVISDDPTKILGRLTANGQIMLINQNGILFGKNSQIDVAGLVASTHDISNQDFLNSKYEFTISGNPNASFINQGNITLADQGIAAFVAPSVQNEGLIAAKLGKVALASGNGFTLDLYGDSLVNLVVEDSVAKTAMDLEGNRLESFVDNSGKIQANGGYVLLTANAARDAVNSVISHSGEIEATSVSEQNGKIVLHGYDSGVVEVSGSLNVSNNANIGGDIRLTGDKVVLLEGSHLDASGKTGGGSILVGGDYQGKGEIPTAQVSYIDKSAFINADAIDRGNGGTIIIWADDTTRAYGNISSKGGSKSGDGGFIEVSGKKFLEIEGIQVSTNAINGKNGTVLFDPENVYIVDKSSFSQSTGSTEFYIPSSNTDTYISAETIEKVLNSGNNVKITTSSNEAGNGNIHVKALITKSTGGDAVLTLAPLYGTYFHNDSGIESRSGRLDIVISPYALGGDLGDVRIGSDVKLITNGGRIDYFSSINVYYDIFDNQSLSSVFFPNSPRTAAIPGCQSPGCIFKNGSIINTGNASGSSNNDSSYTRVTVDRTFDAMSEEEPRKSTDYLLAYNPDSNMLPDSPYNQFTSVTGKENPDGFDYLTWGSKEVFSDIAEGILKTYQEVEKKGYEIGLASNDQTKTETVIQVSGTAIAGTFGVVTAPLLNNSSEKAIEAAINSFKENTVIDDVLSTAIKKAAGTKAGQAFIDAYNESAESALQYLEDNPRVKRNLEAGLDWAELIATLKVVKVTKNKVDGSEKVDNSVIKDSVDEGDVGRYGDLAPKSIGDGLTPDHIPSFASVRKALDDADIEMSDDQLRALRNNTNCVVVQTCDHQSFSRTYGGRNSQNQIKNDSKELYRAVEADLNTWEVVWKKNGWSNKKIEQTRNEVHRLNNNLFKEMGISYEPK